VSALPLDNSYYVSVIKLGIKYFCSGAMLLEVLKFKQFLKRTLYSSVAILKTFANGLDIYSN
jgi:hypothetical protein